MLATAHAYARSLTYKRFERERATLSHALALYASAAFSRAVTLSRYTWFERERVITIGCLVGTPERASCSFLAMFPMRVGDCTTRMRSAIAHMRSCAA